MDKLKSIVYTIANLQDEINEKTMLTQRLLEENQKLKGELAMLKNERNIDNLKFIYTNENIIIYRCISYYVIKWMQI